MAELFISAAAEADYAVSLQWYAERSERAAERFEAAFIQAQEAIAKAPERFPLCDDRHRYYLLKRYPFQIIYRPVSAEHWLIVAVAHTSRQSGYWHQR